MRERPLSSVPRSALLLLGLGLCFQLAWHSTLPRQQAKAERLPAPPSPAALKIASFGEPIALARALMLYLQAFDNQPGISIPFRTLDYGRVQEWLDRMLRLDPAGQYPLFAASRLYGEVSDETRQRRMLEFVHQRFLEDPDRRWPWLAHAAIVAKHHLKDLPLARQYAQAIRLHATGADVPGWAKQMEIFVLEDMDELESAKTLIGGLLDSGTVADPHEIRFLAVRLEELKTRQQQRQSGNAR